MLTRKFSRISLDTNRKSPSSWLTNFLRLIHSNWSHRADGGLLVAELLFVSRHHVFDLQLLHDLLLLQVGVLLLRDGASQLLRVRLGQTGLQLVRQGIPAQGGARERLSVYQ